MIETIIFFALVVAIGAMVVKAFEWRQHFAQRTTVQTRECAASRRSYEASKRQRPFRPGSHRHRDGFVG